MKVLRALRTLTGGAVKPRSSVDVDELRQRIPEGNSRLAPSVPDSSKSMDDDIVHSLIV